MSDEPSESFVADNGAGSYLTDASEDNVNLMKIELINIDKFVECENVKKIDFIKMDIEGFEREALIGAKDTIKKFKPSMAISLYHKHDDFHMIPEIISNIRDDYNYNLRHTSDALWETVLFAN